MVSHQLTNSLIIVFLPDYSVVKRRRSQKRYRVQRALKDASKISARRQKRVQNAAISQTLALFHTRSCTFAVNAQASFPLDRKRVQTAANSQTSLPLDTKKVQSASKTHANFLLTHQKGKYYRELTSTAKFIFHTQTDPPST